ncbi:acyltransferase [Roseateles depolymerans]|uniref:Transferase n=1 Tax=Roseateles depolymerans TaxID=76731 RepID=A0A0U3LAZ8_9BURK|nr:acyltransferase [Roseateles depolymerans]ALV08510.1 transferase [Roseateles depolymerans]REG21264.1 succinyltransferase-like protein [Roseateles depolymerans]
MKASLRRRLWQPVKMLVSRLWGTRMVGGFVRGDGTWLPHTRLSNTTVVFARERLDVGDHVFIGHFSVLDATYGLRIGEGCQIGFFTGIFTHSSHAAIRLYGREYVRVPEKKAYFTAPVDIGDYCFVGAHATLLPGTRLGRGSIVSAYSLVSGEHPDFAILAGQPAKVVGDTRRMDERLLREHPELMPFYEAWAGGLPGALMAADAAAETVAPPMPSPTAPTSTARSGPSSASPTTPSSSP